MNNRIAPELSAGLSAFLESVGGALDAEAMLAMRLRGEAPAVEIPIVDVEGVSSEDRIVSGNDDQPDIPIRIFRPVAPNPSASAKTNAAFLWIHGGGYIFGDIDQDDAQCKAMVKALGVTIVSVDYRLAPECPYPMPLEDCYTALKWLFENNEELKVDRSRIAIIGHSAGGGLAAALALLARDRAEVDIAFQVLMYPMIDDHNIIPLEEMLADDPIWNRKSNRVGWQSYLADRAGGDDVPVYAAPARAANLSGLPPTYIAVGEVDPFLHENIGYAQKLLQAGVATELHVYPGGFHGFEHIVPDAEMSKRCTAERNDAIRRALLV